MKMFLIIGAVATGVTLLTEVVSLAFPPVTEDQELIDNPFGTAILLLIFLLSLLDTIINLTTVVVYLIWLYRAYDNLRVLNPWNRLQHSPGWAVGSFFVPFVNLVVPYQAVKEVWQKSGSREEALMSAPSPPASFPLWWTFWLIASFANHAALRVSFNEDVPDSTATMISIFAGAVSVIAAVFAYLVVDAIDKRQEETTGRVRLGTFSGPPPPPTNLSNPDVVTTPGPSYSQS